jgi:peptide/nickel transport system permease protein
VIRLVASRLLRLIPVLFIVSLATFLMVNLIPGEPAIAILGPNASRADYLRVNHELGLDRPVVERYFDWLGGAVRGDLGVNLLPPTEHVSARLARALPVNIELALLAMALSLAIAIPLGMWSAYRAGSRFDRIVTGVSFAAISVPTFLAAVLMVLVFAINWGLFPVSQWARPTEEGWLTNLHHAFLPALALALPEAAVFTRLLRNDMMATLQEDFVLAARAKGMSTWHVLTRQALRPSSFSLVTLCGISMGRLIGGTIIIEQVFALPGLGRVIVTAAKNNDFTLVQGGVLLVAVIYVTINLVVDILYGVLDPRVRRAGH